MYALAATNPARYRGIIVICITERVVEVAAAALDRQTDAIGTAAFAWLTGLEIIASIALLLALPPISRGERWDGVVDSVRSRARPGFVYDAAAIGLPVIGSCQPMRRLHRGALPNDRMGADREPVDRQRELVH